MTANNNENKFTISLPTGLFGSTYNTTIAFTVAILLFFLPFITIKCNSVQLASATGKQIATGFKIEPDAGIKNFKNIIEKSSKKYNNDDDSDDDNLKKPISIGETFNGNTGKTLKPNYFLAAAFVAGFFGLALSLVPFKQRWIACAIAGWIGVGGFIGTLFTVYEQTQDYNVDLGMINLSASFTLWFFLSFIGFFAATVFSHKHRNAQWSRDKQKEIDEFITASGYTTAESSINDSNTQNTNNY